MKACRFCGRSSSPEVRLIRYTDYGGEQYYGCNDESECHDIIFEAEAAGQSPPVDQVMRIIGAPELPGLTEDR